MRIALKLSIVFLILISKIIAEDDFTNEPSFLGPPTNTLDILQGEPSAIVAHAVNVITGDYIDMQTDLLIPGAQELTWKRFYCSSLPETTDPFEAWKFNHDIRIERESTRSTVHLHDCYGSQITFTNNHVAQVHYKTGKEFTFRINSDHFKRRITNTGCGEISARTHLKNWILTRKLKERVVSLKDGAGTEYLFENAHRDEVTPITQLIKPSGHNIQYDFKSDTPSITARNKATQQHFSKLNLKWTKPSKDVKELHVTSSNGKEATYKYERVKRRHDRDAWVMVRAERSHGPTEEYLYNTAKTRIVRKNRPKGRFLEIEYISSKEDSFLRGYVKTLKAPAKLGSQEAVPIYHFYYYPKTKKVQELDIAGNEVFHTIAYGGQTHVTDAYGHLTKYFINDDDRLARIQKFVGTEANKRDPYCREDFFWGEFGNQMAKSFTSENNLIAHTTYEYDKHGNVAQETLYGNLSGQFSGQVKVNEKSGKVENEGGCEKVQIKRTFCKTAQGYQVKKESHPTLRHWFKYDYDDKGRLTTRFTIEHGEIRLREFFEYDAVTGFLVAEIVDDGTTYNRDDLRISERHIKRIKNTTTFPLGLPEVVEEKYLDLSTGNEMLLHKVVNHYFPGGRLRAQDHFDCQGTYQYTLEWQYNSFGQIIYEKNALGHEIKRTFDQNGNLESEEMFHLKYEYSYDNMNRLSDRKEIWNTGTILVSKQAYDLMGNCTSATDIHGNTMAYGYDDFGRVIAITHPLVKDEYGNLKQVTEKRGYDALGNVVSVTDTNGFTTHAKYTIRGKPFEIIYPDGSQETMKYHWKGQLHEHIARNGSKTVYEYDYLGRPTKKMVYSKDGQLLSSSERHYNAFHIEWEKDSAGHVTHYTYDCAGRLIRKVREQQRVEYGYDVLNRQNETREFYGSGPNDYIATKKKFDLLDRVVEEKITDGTSKVYSLVTSKYEDRTPQKEIITTDGEGCVIKRTLYNARGEVVKIVDADGHETLTHYQYPLRTIEKRDQKNNTIITIFDALGRTEKVEYRNPSYELFKLSEYAYDAVGNVKQQKETVFCLNEVSREVFTRWEYDAMRQVKTQTEAVGTAQQKTTVYEYETSGKLKILRKQGKELCYDYDGLGRLHEYRASDGSFHYTYAYDENGNLKEVHDHVLNKVSTREYANHSSQFMKKETLAHGLAMIYSHDYLGRVRSVTLPDTSKIAYEYEGPHLHKVIRQSPAGEELYAHAYHEYDLKGNPEKAQRIGQNGWIDYGYDVQGRLNKIHTAQFSEIIDERDSLGYVCRRTLSDPIEQVKCLYTFDDLNQLKTEDGIAAHTFVHDSLFNQCKKDADVAKIDDLNQLRNLGPYHFDYDLNGNRTLIQGPEGSQIYDYDAQDRLVGVTTDSTKICYEYDAFNRRLSKTFYSQLDGEWKIEGTMLFLYQGNAEIGSCDSQGHLDELRLLGSGRGDDIGAAVAMELDGEIFAPLHDHLGHIVGLSRMDGTLFETYRYSSFGEEQIYDASQQLIVDSKNPWRYASKRKDPETGFIYFGMRYYDPLTSRWITPDPIGRLGGPNLYAYALNNPLAYMDLWGLSPEVDRWIDYEVDRITDMIRQSDQNHRDPNRHPLMRSDSEITCIVGSHSYQDKKIVYVNGMNNTKEYALRTACIISEYVDGHEVKLIYNCTNGVVSDFCRWVAEYKFPFFSRSVNDELKKEIEQFAEASPHLTMQIICTSEGVTVTRNTAGSLNDNLKSKIEIVAISPSAYIDKNLCNNITHYCSRRDFVPIADAEGYMRNLNTVRVLEPHLNAPWFDHSIRSPTFEEPITRELNQYLKR